MKRFTVFIIVLFFAFSFNVSAENYSAEDFIKEQAQLSGAEDLDKNLPEETREYFNKNEIDPADGNWINSFNIVKIFGDLWQTVIDKIKAPLSFMGLILAVVLISGALNSLETGITHTTLNFAVTAISAAAVTAPLLSVINSSVAGMQSVSLFMAAFLPVFGTLLATSGHVATSVSMSGLLLGATQVVELIANHLIVPLMCGYLSVSVASGVSPLLSKTTISASIKKLSFWIMSLVTTVFLGILSIQTTVNASADTLTIRTAKFIIGSTVPMAGTVLSEALSTVTASLGILKTSVAIYGVVACGVILLPLLLELLLWRLCLGVTAIACDLLSAETTGKLLRSIDGAISVLCGIILLTGALFIISLSVLVTVSKV